MRIKILNKYKEYPINLTKFTQLCGLDFVKKNFIVDSIAKYFSSSKYNDYEENMIDNVVYENNEQIGRKHFKIIRINTRPDIIELIKFSKLSMFQEYINVELQKFDSKNILEEINDLLTKLYINVNKDIIQDIGNIKLDYETENIINIIQKSYINNINDISIEENSNYELLQIVFNIIQKLQNNNPTKILIIINNIDHLISKEQYSELYNQMKDIINSTDTYFLQTISINNYTEMDIENIDGINIINDTIFNLESFEKFKEYIINNYPINIDIEDNDLLTLTNMILQHIGNNSAKNDLRSNIILKLLNDSLSINFESKTNLNNIEIAFLNS